MSVGLVLVHGHAFMEMNETWKKGLSIYLMHLNYELVDLSCHYVVKNN